MIDFSKPLEVDTEYSLEEFHDAKILAVYPVNYSNSLFTHAVHYRKADGTEGLEAVTVKGVARSWLAFRNVKPKVVREIWLNCYPSGRAGAVYYCRLSAERNAGSNRRMGTLHTTIYDDGSVEQEYIKI